MEQPQSPFDLFVFKHNGFVCSIYIPETEAHWVAGGIAAVFGLDFILCSLMNILHEYCHLQIQSRGNVWVSASLSLVVAGLPAKQTNSKYFIHWII